MPTGTGRKNVQDFSRGPAMKTTKELLAYPEMTVDGTPGGEKIGDNVSVMGPKGGQEKGCQLSVLVSVEECHEPYSRFRID